MSAAALAAFTLLAAGLPACGGDEEPERPAAAGTAPAATDGEPTATASPEEQPGGAGDEEPIQVDAVITGADGRLSPATIQVPPFFQIKLVLRSADGRDYAIEVARGKAAKVGEERPRAELTLEGLRPGDRYVARSTGFEARGQRVEIVASAEPGP